jgi:ABC-type cobalamin/Fe3+-siderophores transport system ATPase subunit
MKTAPVYIKNLKLKNIRTFGKVELNFENEDATLSQWRIILGDNSIGKSTLLQCVAWMELLLPYKKEEALIAFVPSPVIKISV